MQAAPSQPRSASLSFPRLGLLSSERSLLAAHMGVSLVALIIGCLLGPFQAYRRSPFVMETFPDLRIPVFSYYYQALTVHGIFNALVFTTFFIVGFSYFTTQRALQRPLWNTQIAWVGFGLMFVGLTLTGIPLIMGNASVLYTFYPNLLASPLFYLGLTLVVVGTWVASLVIFMTYRAWKRENRGKTVPLAVFIILVNYIIWDLATIGVAAEILFMLLPLSLGLIQTTDPQVGRVLFWYFGHPLVYFWLLPAYVSWYTMLPRQTGSKLFSEPLARVSFILFLLLSIPVGAHHLFADPGVSESSKTVHTILTLLVAVPSFLTAFNIGAMLERAGRLRGARSPLGWMIRQDWGNPVIAAQLSAMLLFIAGGFSGIINASLTLNIALHNTSWIPGHFHQTVGGAVTLTYLGVIYWLLPLIRGRALFSRGMALGQIYLWLFGMSLFGHGMAEAGLGGVPRRADLAGVPYIEGWEAFWLNQAAIGGTLLFISVILLIINLVGTLFFSRKPVVEDAPDVTVVHKSSPEWFERWGLWIGLAIILVVMAWIPVLGEAFNLTEGFKIYPYRPEIAVPIK